MKRKFYNLIPFGLALIFSIIIFSPRMAVAGGWAMVTLISLLM